MLTKHSKVKIVTLILKDFCWNFSTFDKEVAMKQIILMRHGMSIGNERKIIQGQLDYGLSKTGIE